MKQTTRDSRWVNLWVYLGLSAIFLAIIVYRAFGLTLLSSIHPGWAPITAITTLSFFAVFTIRMRFNHILDIGLLGILLLIHLLQVVDTAFDCNCWVEYLAKSSTATSIMFFISIVSYLVIRYNFYTKYLVSATIILYLLSSGSLAFYALDPKSLYVIPFFESMSWYTAFFFMLVSTLDLSTYQHLDVSKMKILRGTSRLFNFNEIVKFGAYIPMLLFVGLSAVNVFIVNLVKYDILVLYVIVAGIPLFFYNVIKTKNYEWKKFEYEITSDLKNKIDELNARNERLMGETEMRKQAAQITSHNLRGTAVAIRNLTEMLLQNINNPNLFKEMITLLQERVDQNIKILEDLGNYYNNLRDENKLIELCHWNDEIYNIFTECKQQYKTKARLIIKGKLDPIYYPHVFFTSLVQNIFSNSFKYRDPNRVLQIEIESYEDEDWKSFVFSDNGKGLDVDAFKNQLFKYGKTFHGNHDANGLGLFMLKGQLTIYGNRLSMNGELGNGVQITVKFSKFLQRQYKEKYQGSLETMAAKNV